MMPPHTSECHAVLKESNVSITTPKKRKKKLEIEDAGKKAMKAEKSKNLSKFVLT